MRPQPVYLKSKNYKENGLKDPVGGNATPRKIKILENMTTFKNISILDKQSIANKTTTMTSRKSKGDFLNHNSQTRSSFRKKLKFKKLDPSVLEAIMRQK